MYSPTVSIRLSVKVAWWVKAYLRLVVLQAKLTGKLPDPDLVERRIRRGVRATSQFTVDR